MDILILLVPMSLVLVALIGVAFAWSVRSGQYDDLEGPAHRILADDDGAHAPPAAGAGLTPVNPAGVPARTMGTAADGEGGETRGRRVLTR